MSEYYKASKGRWNSSQRAIVYIIITMHARIVPHLFAKYARCITHVQTYTHTYIRKHVLYVHRHIVCVFVYLCICVHAYLVLAKRAGWAHGGPSLFKICKEGIACRFQGHVCLCVCVCVFALQCSPTVRGFVLQNNAADIARFRARFCTCLHACMLCYPLSVSMGISNNNLVHMTT